MTVITLILTGALAGILLTIFVIGKMMEIPTTRVWLSDRVNMSNNQLPDDCYQLVRYGKWIAGPADKEDI